MAGMVSLIVDEESPHIAAARGDAEDFGLAARYLDFVLRQNGSLAPHAPIFHEIVFGVPRDVPLRGEDAALISAAVKTFDDIFSFDPEARAQMLREHFPEVGLEFHRLPHEALQSHLQSLLGGVPASSVDAPSPPIELPEPATLICDSCISPASVVCTDKSCQALICSRHFEEHPKTHTVFPVNDFKGYHAGLTRPPRCQQHPRPLTLYCFHCHACLCLDCAVNHKHVLSPIDTAVAQISVSVNIALQFLDGLPQAAKASLIDFRATLHRFLVAMDQSRYAALQTLGELTVPLQSVVALGSGFGQLQQLVVPPVASSADDAAPLTRSLSTGRSSHRPEFADPMMEKMLHRDMRRMTDYPEEVVLEPYEADDDEMFERRRGLDYGHLGMKAKRHGHDYPRHPAEKMLDYFPPRGRSSASSSFRHPSKKKRPAHYSDGHPDAFGGEKSASPSFLGDLSVELNPVDVVKPALEKLREHAAVPDTFPLQPLPAFASVGGGDPRIARHLSGLLEAEKRQVASLQKELNESQQTVRETLTQIAALESRVNEKDNIIEGQKRQILETRIALDSTSKELIEAKHLIETSKSHVAGVHSHDNLVNPTDLSVHFPHVRGCIKSYVEEMHSEFKSKKELSKKFGAFLAAFVGPHGVAADQILMKHLLLAVVSHFLFAHFDQPDFAPNQDVSTGDREKVRTAKSHEFLELSKHPYEDAVRTNGAFRSWAAHVTQNFKHFLEPFLEEHGVKFDTFVTSYFQAALKSVYLLHSLCFAFYPRPDLILRRPGSNNFEFCESWKVFYKREDEEDSVMKGSVAFMMIPGLYFEKTSMKAIVYPTDN